MLHFRAAAVALAAPPVPVGMIGGALPYPGIGDVNSEQESTGPSMESNNFRTSFHCSCVQNLGTFNVLFAAANGVAPVRRSWNHLPAIPASD
ncbi:hypothetical protein SBOR_9679 [Sclerotinia borealis F-4128]|uniref:Uncharacterized protein n=1 Tax=Sclerotinia borealis (strain F-4128) TaxID=1432307 RepID=W9C2L5_SCLBF|nr:hypothetical protein SBOR_9679 [Sclerotinia borealis F-4128]